MPKLKRRAIKITLIIIFILVILGGGGVSAYYAFFSERTGGDETQTTNNQTSTVIPTQDIMTIIEADSNLSNFSKLLTASGVKFTLQTVGTNYLVLTTNNDGYKSLPAGYYDSLLTVEKQTIAQNIAKYQVALLPATDLVDGQKLKTLNGQELIVGLKDGKLTFKDAKANVANAIGDVIKATNGSMYVIDLLLLPQ